MAYTTLAFGFLPTGGFALGHHATFDRDVPHYFVMVPTVHKPTVFAKEEFSITPTTQGPKEKTSSKRARRSTKAAKGTKKSAQLSKIVSTFSKLQKKQKLSKKGKSKKPVIHKLTAMEKAQGWELPSKKHTSRSQGNYLMEAFHDDNVFAALSTLSCSQKKEIDRTGTLQMPIKSLASRRFFSPKRKMKKIATCMAISSEEETEPQVPPRGRMTRSTARSLTEEPEFLTLSGVRTQQPRRRNVMPRRTATAYMADENPSPPTMEDLLRSLMGRFDRLEAEQRRIQDQLTTVSIRSQGDPGSSHGYANISNGNPSAPASSAPILPQQSISQPPQPPAASPASNTNIQEMAGVPGIATAQMEEFLNGWLKKQGVIVPTSEPLTHHRPYPTEIEAEAFPPGFHLPDLRKYNGRGNPQEHIESFTGQLINLSHNPNYLLRLFGSSLTGNAFQWYLTLPVGSVKTWADMQKLFRGRFFVTQRDVTLADLSNMKQREGESVDSFIDRFQTEASKCTAPIQEIDKVQLCRNGIRREVALLVNEQIASFRELANEACRKELLLDQGSNRTLVKKENTFRLNKREPGESSIKKEITGRSANTAEIKGPNKPKVVIKEEPASNCPFTGEEMYPILLELLKDDTITLPEPRNPAEVGMTNHPKYCHFHRGINHPTKDCITLRRIILACLKKGVIQLKEQANASANICNIVPATTKHRQQKFILQRMKEAWMRISFPYQERCYRWSSKNDPFTLGDYLQPEKLRPFYIRVMRSPSNKERPYQQQKEVLKKQTLMCPWGDEELFWCYPEIHKLPSVSIKPEIATCYATGAETADSANSQDKKKERLHRRKQKQKERRQQGFTKFNDDESPVTHLLRYVHECCGDAPDPKKLVNNFGKSLGPLPKKWFQTSNRQAPKDWDQLVDKFLLRFLARQGKNTREGTLNWRQYFGEDTSSYIHKWRSAMWSDPQTLTRHEAEDVRLCIGSASYPRDQPPHNLIKAVEEAYAKHMKAPAEKKRNQIHGEQSIKYILRYLRRKNAPFLDVFPDIKKLQTLRWPRFMLFREGEMSALNHLLRYEALVRARSKEDNYAARFFPFSLSSDSQALRWIAFLPAKAFQSWEVLAEAFLTRFHEYSIEVSPVQIQRLQILEKEQPYDFILRWIDTRLWCTQWQDEDQMVKECITAMGAAYISTDQVPKTFLDLLRHVLRQQSETMVASCNMVGSMTAKPAFQEKAIPVEEPDPEFPPGFEGMAPKRVEYDVLAHLRRLPARLSIYDALQLSREARTALINALVDDSVRNIYLTEVNEATECHQTITFTDEDLLLGNADHNRPLFVSGNLAGEHINRILLDAGSAVNILPLKTLKKIGISPAQLKSSNLVIQGFNQGSQRAMGTITLNLDIQGFLTKVECQVINAPTSYNLLLGRPWMHHHKVMPSTMHQCFKFYQGDKVRRISADSTPFTVTESFYSDAQYYELAPITSFLKAKTPAAAKEELPTVLPPQKSSPTSRFRVIKDIAQEEKVTLMQELAKLALEEDAQNTNIQTSFPVESQHDKASPTNVQVERLEQKTGCAVPPPAGLYNIEKQLNLISDPPPVTQMEESDKPCCRFQVVAKPSNSFQTRRGRYVSAVRGGKSNRWTSSCQGAQCLMIEYNWPLSQLAEMPVIQDEQQASANLSKQTIFQQCGRPYGQPGISKLLPRERLQTWDFTKYSPQSQKLMSLQGFYPEEPYLSGYGSHIPTPLSCKPHGYRYPGDHTGLGFEDIENADREEMSFITFKSVGFTAPNEDFESLHTYQSNIHTVYCVEGHSQDESESSAKEEKEFGCSPAPPNIEDGGQPTIDELEEFNLGSDEDKRPIFVAKALPQEEKQQFINLLREFRDVFAWTYSEMPGLKPDVAMHYLHISQEKKPIKQAPRKFRPELEQQIIQEIDKLKEAKFIREVQFPKWISSIVPVKKKNGQIRVCVDFRDLNEACPKDEFPLPHMELLIDSTSLYDTFSFMDGYSGYNQIHMASEDEEFTSFRTPMGIFCYRVMPFGLKNAGATYQRAMQVIFHDMLHQHVECYVDDLVVRSNGLDQHRQDLRTVFKRLRKQNLRMNPLKCAFGVGSGKFLGFIIRHRGIEIDPQKIEAIQNMSPPQNIRELRSLQGKLSYIRRFIANLAGRCQPFHALLKKDTIFTWDDACQKAFDAIKKLLYSPPILAAPIKGKPLILYISASEHALGALLAQENIEKKEQALYYLSRRLIGAEEKYSPIEKTCLALVFAAQKLRHYFLAHEIKLISRADPLKFLITRPMLSGRLAKWSLLLSEFDITYIPQKAVKGQALADFLAEHPIKNDQAITDELPDEEAFLAEERTPWQMYFDGAAKATASGIGIVFISPQRDIIPYSFYLDRKCTNNETEYEALIMGLQLALDFGIDKLDIFGDSELVVRQLTTEYEVRQDNLRWYYDLAQTLLDCFYDIRIQHVSRVQNIIADALANLATALAVGSGQQIIVKVECRRHIPASYLKEEMQTAYVVNCLEATTKDWRLPFVEYLQHGILPDDPQERMNLRKKALKYVYHNNTLYRQAYDGLWLRCLDGEEAKYVLTQAHSSECGGHPSGHKLSHRIKRMGYYWPTMVTDSLKFAKSCHQCQLHGDINHVPSAELTPASMSWPFAWWGFDIIGPINPTSSKGHAYILAATDYFSKWAEASAYKRIRAKEVIEFIKFKIIYRYGVPYQITSDNGTPFKNNQMEKFCQQWGMKHIFSSPYYPQGNGQAEAFNKAIIKILKRMLVKNKREWHLRLPEALWAYRTIQKTATGATPYSLVFGAEAVLPLEVQLPSLRVAVHAELTTEQKVKARLEELDALDEKRLAAKQRIELYQARMAESYNRTVRRKTYQPGDLVLKLRTELMAGGKLIGKFEPKWEGPYVIQEAYTNGSYKIVKSNGIEGISINGKFLKPYYP